MEWWLRHVTLVTAATLWGAGVWNPLPTVSLEPPQNPTPFRVSVDLVRVDAVVTDQRGRIVPNLTAADFELRQDGQLQSISSVQFVSLESDAGGQDGAGSVSSNVNSQPGRQRAQRTFVVLVDDLSLSLEGLYYTQRALGAFVEDNIRPTDLVALSRSGGVVAAPQSFTTDRRVLRAMIDGLRWNGFSRNRYYPAPTVKDFQDFERPAVDFAGIDSLRRSMSATATLGALILAIRGARDLPGRKVVILVSEGFALVTKGETDLRVRDAMDRVIDEAARAGVVIYVLDARGLQTVSTADTQETMAYLAQETGGFAVLNTNDLKGGLARIVDSVRGYYILGYAPPTGTFQLAGNKPRLHRVSVRSKRNGLNVRTQRSFIGVSDAPHRTNDVDSDVGSQLIRAAISPFAASDVAVRVNALTGFSRAEGTFVHALLHIDATSLGFNIVGDKARTATFDVIGIAFDVEGNVVARKSSAFTIALTDEYSTEGLREGLGYSFRIPVRAPGAYQVRFAVRDRQTGSVGAAGEFVEIPDIREGTFALSGIALRNKAADQASPSSSSAWLGLTPDQAFQVYQPGSELTYTYEVYNASKTVTASVSLWRGSERVFGASTGVLTIPPGNGKPQLVRGTIRLNSEVASGRYVLEVAAQTQIGRRPGQEARALQRIAFDVQ